MPSPTIRFELRRNPDNDKTCPIRMIYQISQEKKAFKTDQAVFAENWDQKQQRAVYIKGKKAKMTESEINDVNIALAALAGRINKIQDRFEANDLQYDIEMVAADFNAGNTSKTSHSKASTELYAFIDQYIANHSEIRVKGSLSVYRSLKAHLEGYEQKNGGRSVNFEKMDSRFFQAFQNYLVGLEREDKAGNITRRLNNITIAKQLSTLKTFLGYAREDRTIKVPDINFKVKRQTDLEIIALTEDEYQKLKSLDLSAKPQRDQVRDVFIFSCATGLRFSDLSQLRREHIRGDELDLRAIKTGSKTNVPLSPDALSILAKYKDRLNPLPVISNQKSNDALEKICKQAGIDTPVEIVRNYGNQRVAKVYPKYELIRMHCGRKTFASRMIALGMRAEIVMKIGGWKSWASFKRYMHISDETAKAEMTAIFSKHKKLKAV